MSAPTRQPWRLHPITESLSWYRPVLAASLLRKRDGDWEILTGVRTPAANRTHPDVVSVPTLRVPEAIARTWPGDDGSVMREVTNLLARKLGVADALELGLISLAQRHFGGWQGTSVIGEDDDTGLITEDLTMFNACVEVLSGSELFPPRTASYDPLMWARLPDFLRMARTREVAHLGVDLDPIQFCAYGLCLTSSELALADFLGES